VYRKRELARRGHSHGGIARFRYSDMKEAARFAADAGAMQVRQPESFGIVPIYEGIGSVKQKPPKKNKKIADEIEKCTHISLRTGRAVKGARRENRVIKERGFTELRFASFPLRFSRTARAVKGQDERPTLGSPPKLGNVVQGVK
jgi:hypothetical protein